MKKVKKMADGGISGLGQLLGKSGIQIGSPQTPPYIPGGGGGGGGGGGAMEGLGAVNKGAAAIGSALGRASEAIGGGGGGGGGAQFPSYTYKKGGKVTTTRVSTANRSKKSPNW